jgi:heterodisulfide reductase subunit A-like polyferredoxin
LMTLPETARALDHDALIVGAGTAGMEAALSLGDMGYRVLLVEKNSSVGGRTILLSKVFPTLDCASCISTPKMAATAHHPGISLMVHSEVEGITKSDDGTFRVDLVRKATYVDFDACTGCAQCEEACTVPLPDEYNYGLVARRAAHIPFPQAVPKKAVITRTGNAPCMDTCPAGVKPSGYISLVRAGQYDEAFRMHLDDVPLVGSLSRACYAPCEGACTRGDMEGPVHIRAIKRFMADRYYAGHPEPEYGPPETLLDTRVAIVGSGPAGLTAAYHLARQGHRVTIFDADPRPGGMLRHGMPSYRMPHDVLDRDIKNVTALGVEVRCNTTVESIASLKEQGFDAIFVAVGNQVPRIIPLEGKDLANVTDCMEFLRETKCDVSEPPELGGRHVVVLGGGNVALDVARSAVRLGTASTTILCLEDREHMPAHAWEVQEAEEEGVGVITSASAKSLLVNESGEPMLEYLGVGTIEFTPEGRLVSFKVAEGTERQVRADVVILAIGLAPSTAAFAEELELTRQRTILTDPETLQTSDPIVFAGGDAVLGPSIITAAIGQGRRAAYHIDKMLRGHSPIVRYWDKPPVVDKEALLKEQEGHTWLPPTALRRRPPRERVQSFEAYEDTFTEEEAIAAANRCLSCGGCSQCQECVRVCPAHCIDFSMRDEHLSVDVGTVILATGYEILDPGKKELLGYGRYPNVISGPQMDRLLAPTRPYNTVLRPSDGKVPDNIAIVLCNGSRDQTVGNPLCCRVGCMYSAKHAQLIMGALPLADITIYTIDVRAFGKGYDEFYEQSKAMGVQYVRGKVAAIDEKEDGNLLVHFENLASGGMQTMEHDLVVLTVGLVPNLESLHLFKGATLEADEYSFVHEPDAVVEPAGTSIPGLFAAGSVIGARDIPDTVLHAGAAASQAAAYLESLRAS